MELNKHTSGTALTPAEREQRRNAARARWGLAAGAGVIGGLAGRDIGKTRLVRGVPGQTKADLEAADALITQGHVQRIGSILATVKAQNKLIGTDKSKVKGVLRVYDYQLAALNRQLKRGGPPARQAEIKRQINRLNQLSGRSPRPTARNPTMRIANRAQGEAQIAMLEAQLEHLDIAKNPHKLSEAIGIEQLIDETTERLNHQHPVRAHVVRAYIPGGESAKAIDKRISATKAALRARHVRLLGLLERRTTELRAVTAARVVAGIEAHLNQRLARAGLRGGAIGAVIGLTAAGIGLIAHHVAHAEPKQRAALAKAEGDQDAEASIGKGVAETFRQWIDRLLGRSQGPLHLGDGVAAALAPGIAQAFANGATQPPLAQPSGYHIDVDFDQLNPSVRRHMADYALDRIVQITTEQREAIRGILMAQSVLQGIGPREVARSIREAIGLTPYQMNVVRGYRVELENLDPAALERKLRDARYDPTIKRAIQEGKPLSGEQIDAMVDAYHRRMLAMRAETIARTEAIRATSYGAVARAQDVLDQYQDLDVIKTWIATEDERTRPTHRDLDRKEVLGMLTPFRTSAGNLIKWPVDADAVADEVIKCRCSIGFRFVPKGVVLPHNQLVAA